MNAVTTKPRSNAKPNAAPVKPTLEMRLADIESRLALGRKKLSMASESVELTHPGEALDVLLLHVIETMLPDALFPLFERPITAEAMQAAYTGMFPSLAAIEAVLRLADGQAIEPLVREAFVILDAANSDMDMPNALPKAADRGADGTPRESAAATSQKLGFEATGIECNSYCMLSEAVAIIQTCAEAASSDMLYGALYVADRAESLLSDGVAARDTRMCEDASAPIAVAIAVLEAALREVDDVALHGAHRLLDLAKSSLDDALAEAM